MQKGITLVETIVAVTVLIMALGGPFLLAAKSLSAAGYAREEIAAARLAEEGLEVIHNMRDNNAAESDAGRNWNVGIILCSAPNECAIDITKRQTAAGNDSIWITADSLSYNAIIPCTGACTGERARIYVHTSGLYRQLNLAEYGNSIPPGYSKTTMFRTIKVTPVNGLNSREYIVESKVTYVAGKQNKTIVLYDTIMNWFPSMSKIL